MGVQIYRISHPLRTYLDATAGDVDVGREWAWMSPARPPRGGTKASEKRAARASAQAQTKLLTSFIISLSEGGDTSCSAGIR